MLSERFAALDLDKQWKLLVSVVGAVGMLGYGAFWLLGEHPTDVPVTETPAAKQTHDGQSNQGKSLADLSETLASIDEADRRRAEIEDQNALKLIIPTSGSDDYVGKSPQQVVAQREGLTELQSQRFFADTYAGKRVRVSGGVRSVSETSSGRALVILGNRACSVLFDLRPDQHRRALELAEGDRVVIDGRYDSYGVLGTPSAEDAYIVGYAD